MRERFQGKDGKKRLAQAFALQELVLHNDTLAQKLAEVATVSEYQEGQELLVQGQQGDNCLFFILSGSFDLQVAGNCVAIMEPGQAVGEFPIVDPSLSYTVSIRARERGVVAKVSENQFLSLSEEFPSIWKNMAMMLVTRLRKTNELLSNQQTAQDLPTSVGTPDTLTIGEIVKGLTVGQLWKIIIAIVGALAAVATVAYKIGSVAW
jgi:CRP-like cAMP-binding protein